MRPEWMAEYTEQALRFMVGIFKKHDVPYQIAGGFAAKLLGSPRSLNDIDFDIPNDALERIHADIAPYIVWGPGRYVNGKWDIYLVTLNYAGQEIDISGADDGRMSNKDRSAWLPTKVDFTNFVPMRVGDLTICLIPPEDLIAYKSELDGDHQLVDIEAVRGAMMRV